MSKIGKNIKKIRNIKGLSQQAFADLFQLTRGNISSYEELRAEPKIEIAVKIANYFSIPLSDFIEKDLSVNELLHYNTHFVVETEKMKMTHQFSHIPFIPSIYISEYAKQYKDENFISTLPNIVIPSSSHFKLLAIEIDNPSSLPTGFNLRSGDIVILEHIVKENFHQIINRLGFMVNKDGIKAGVYSEKEGQIYLSLNEWIEYPFNFSSDTEYWFLRATYKQDL